MSKEIFVKRACADLGIQMAAEPAPYNANLNQVMKAREAALEAEYAKEE